MYINSSDISQLMLSAVYDVMTTPLTTMHHSEVNFPTSCPKIGLSDTPIKFCPGVHMDDRPKPWNFRENLPTSCREIFWNRNYFFPPPPLQVVRMLRFYFWVLKGPNCTKEFWAPSGPPILEIWWVKGLNFPPPPQKLGGQISSIFYTGCPRDDPQNPENFVKVLRPVSEIYGILLSEPMAEIQWCLLP